MSKSKSNWKKSPWTVAIATVIMTPIVSFIFDIVKDKPIFSTIWGWIVWLWNLIISFLNLNIKVWWLIIGIGVIIFILWIISNINNEPKKSLPDFLEYKRGTLKKWTWGWEWEFDHYKKKWHVSDMHACCPQCNTRLMEGFTHNPDKCPRCDFYASYYFENKKEIEYLILDNIDKGNYPKKQQE